MKGAYEYCHLFPKMEQFGRLIVWPKSNARGKTFHIYVVPKNFKAASNGWCPSPENDVEVYGVIGGNSGHSEEYGWVHHGPWEKDFAIVCHARRLQLEKQEAIGRQLMAGQKNDEANRIQNLLDQY